jgi:hypothetical protein
MVQFTYFYLIFEKGIKKYQKYTKLKMAAFKIHRQYWNGLVATF